MLLSQFSPPAQLWGMWPGDSCGFFGSRQPKGVDKKRRKNLHNICFCIYCDIIVICIFVYMSIVYSIV